MHFLSLYSISCSINQYSSLRQKTRGSNDIQTDRASEFGRDQYNPSAVAINCNWKMNHQSRYIDGTVTN